ncbi:MAG: thrombospondin type 3 repeat-containing protein [Chloroflexi bacterium]|nr:thrombospondin type 3 repeat-containing protein [Chloroflexota bacterium]
MVIIVVIAVAALIGVSQAERSEALFHIMRVYGVVGGVSDDTDVQYVELRMAASGQSLLGGHHLCFYDASGSAYARFDFTGVVANSANGASILIGTSEFDAVWSSGSPDYVFSGANTIAIAGGADVFHPVRSSGGKVSFGTDSTAIPAQMCQGSFALVDSVAYGTGYSGGVDFGTKLNADLPIGGSDAVRLQGPVCFPPGCTQENSTDYAITDVNVPGDHTRNNAGAVGPIDSDGDGIPDGTDNCPQSPNPGQGLSSWPVPAGDPDCDGTTSAHETVIGTDPLDPCGLSAWPPDFDDNGVINTTDVFQVLPPTFGTGVPPTSVRNDLFPDGVINTTDVFRVLPPFLGSSCT